MNISDEAVEAAAKAMVTNEYAWAEWEEHYLARARTALEAAAPHMQVGNYTCPSECAAMNHPGAEHGVTK